MCPYWLHPWHMMCGQANHGWPNFPQFEQSWFCVWWSVEPLFIMLIWWFCENDAAMCWAELIFSTILMAFSMVAGPFSYTPGAILLLLISPFRKILICAGCELKLQCLASFLNLWIHTVNVSESFCWISMNLEVQVCILALFRWLQSCSLMWGQGWFSISHSGYLMLFP